MAGMIDSYEGDVLEYIVSGAGTAVSPTTWYAALFTTAPNEAGTGFVEVTNAGAYAREQIPAASWDASATTGQPTTISNDVAIEFTTATAQWSSGSSVTHFGLCLSGTHNTSDVKIWGALDASKVVDNGDTVSFAIGALTIKLGDPGDTYT